MRRELAVAAALVALCAAAFHGVLDADFLSYDDDQYVTRNAMVRGGLTWPGLRAAFTSFHVYNWHPLTWLSHMLDVELFGLSARAHHAMSAALHAAASVALFGWLHAATGALGRSALVAALFAVHPVHVESVAWISERKDVLCALLWFLAAWTWVGWTRGRAPRAYGAALLLFAAGALAKPMIVTFPFVLLLMDAWPLGRTPRLVPRLALWVEKLPFLAVAAACAGLTLAAQSAGGAVRDFESFPLLERLANAPVACVRYLAKLAFPSGLAVFYPPRTWSPPLVAGALALLGALTAGALWLRRERPALAFGWLFFLGTLAPVIGVVQVGDQSLADRYAYVPSVGVFVALVWGGAALADRVPGGPRAAAALASAAVLGCAGLTVAQVRHWRSTEALFRHALAVTEGNYVAHNNMGAALTQAGALEESLPHFEAAIRLRARHAEAHYNLGTTLGKLGRLDEAVRHLRLSVRFAPDRAPYHLNLAKAYEEGGALDAAESALLRALERLPQSVELQERLGRVRALRGDIPGAIAAYRAALALEPSRPVPLRFLAWTLATHPDPALRDGPEALRLAERVVALTPSPGALELDLLAAAHAEVGDFARAEQVGRQAAQLAALAGDGRLAASIALRSGGYHRGEAYREGP